MGPTGRSSTEVQEWAVDRPGDADGRVAVITGASSGVGLEVAGLLAARRALLINNAGLVLDLLAAVPGSRVVTVTSPAHRQGRIDFDDLQATRRYRKADAYAQSKLANLLFAHELQRRLAAGGAKTISVAAHPGGARSELNRHMPWVFRGPSGGWPARSPTALRRARCPWCGQPSTPKPAAVSTTRQPAAWSSRERRCAGSRATLRMTPSWQAGCGLSLSS